MSPTQHSPTNPFELISQKYTTSYASNLIILAENDSHLLQCLLARLIHLIRDLQEPVTICTLNSERTKLIREALDKANAALPEHKRLPQDSLQKLNIGTFHALCCQFLRKHAHCIDLDPNFHVISQHDSEYYLSEIVQQYQHQHGAQPRPQYSIHDICNHISECKLDLVSPQTFLNEIVLTETDSEKRARYMFLHEVYYQYESLKEQTNVLDYDDLLFKTIELFNSHPHVYTQRQSLTQHILIHDFHLLNDLQYEIFKKISNDSISISITAHSQSDTKYLDYFKADYGEYKVLSFDEEQSFLHDNDSQNSSSEHNDTPSSPQSSNHQLYNPLSPLCEGVLLWRWHNSATQSDSTAESPNDSSAQSATANYNSGVHLHTTFHRDNLLFGFKTTEDYIPQHCVRIADARERGQLNIDIFTDDKYREEEPALTLCAETEDMRKEWMLFFSREYTPSHKGMYSSDKTSIPMPELFHQRVSSGDIDTSKLYFPIIEGPDPFKDQIQGNFQFLRRLLEDTHTHAESLLIEDAKSRLGGSNALKHELAKINHVARFQQHEVLDVENLNASGDLVSREDVENWLMQWSKLLSDRSLPPVSEEKDRLVMQKIIHDLEERLDRLETAERENTSLSSTSDKHSTVEGDFSANLSANHTNSINQDATTSNMNTSQTKTPEREESTSSLSIEAHSSMHEFGSGNAQQSVETVTIHLEQQSSISSSENAEQNLSQLSAKSDAEKSAQSPQQDRVSNHSSPQMEQQDFFNIMDTIKRLEQKMDQLDGSSHNEADRESIREEFKNTLKRLSRSGFFGKGDSNHSTPQKESSMNSSLIQQTDNSRVSSDTPSRDIPKDTKSPNKDQDLLRDMQQLLESNDTRAVPSKNTSTHSAAHNDIESQSEEEEQLDPPHPTPYPEQRPLSSESTGAETEDSSTLSNGSPRSSVATTHVNLKSLTPSVHRDSLSSSSNDKKSLNVSFSEEVSVQLYDKEEPKKRTHSSPVSSPQSSSVRQGGISTPQFFRLQGETMTPTSRASVEKMLNTGNSFYLHSPNRSQKKKLRFFYLSQDCKYLCWSHPDRKYQNKKSGKIALSNILCIQRGEEVKSRRNEAIKTSFANSFFRIKKEESKVDVDTLFSIVCNDRYFDLEARSKEEAKLWSKAFEKYLRTASAFKSGYKTALESSTK